MKGRRRFVLGLALGAAGAGARAQVGEPVGATPGRPGDAPPDDAGVLRLAHDDAGVLRPVRDDAGSLRPARDDAPPQDHAAPSGGAAPQARGEGFPRLLGMNIGAKHYHEAGYQAQLARLDIVILAFYPRWRGDRDGRRMREVVRALKARNPGIKVGQYTVLNEAVDDRGKNAANADLIDKLDREGWWLRAADGAKVQWTRRYGAQDVNITEWAAPDAEGRRYPQWLAERDARQYFDRVPELDIWYFDNVMARPRTRADWRRARRDVDGSDAEVAAAFRRAMAAHWQAAARLHPDKLFIGNADSDLSEPEFRGRLQGVFLEGLMGRTWSIGTRLGWQAAMQRYRSVRGNLRPPAIVGFNVAGRADDYRFMRHALASCLLGDGHFSFTDERAGYGSVPWFDEYDVRLGRAQEPMPAAAWREGVYRRRYEHALVLVNPQPAPRTVALEPGWRRWRGRQAPDVNDGSEARTVTLQARDGLILVRPS